jgi:uncharacterized protein
MIYLDTSALVPYYCPEPNSETAEKIMAEFRSHVGQNLFPVISVRPLHYQIAKNWIERFATPLRTLDALHLAVAFSNSLTVLTADRKLGDSARSLGVKFTFL